MVSGRTAEKFSDLGTIKTDLDFIMGQIARLPTRPDLARAVLVIMFAAIFRETAGQQRDQGAASLRPSTSPSSSPIA